jgi:hypothetical protein
VSVASPTNIVLVGETCSAGVIRHIDVGLDRQNSILTINLSACTLSRLVSTVTTIETLTLIFLTLPHAHFLPLIPMAIILPSHLDFLIRACLCAPHHPTTVDRTTRHGSAFMILTSLTTTHVGAKYCHIAEALVSREREADPSFCRSSSLLSVLPMTERADGINSSA